MWICFFFLNSDIQHKSTAFKVGGCGSIMFFICIEKALQLMPSPLLQGQWPHELSRGLQPHIFWCVGQCKIDSLILVNCLLLSHNKRANGCQAGRNNNDLLWFSHTLHVILDLSYDARIKS